MMTLGPSTHTRKVKGSCRGLYDYRLLILLTLPIQDLLLTILRTPGVLSDVVKGIEKGEGSLPLSDQQQGIDFCSRDRTGKEQSL